MSASWESNVIRGGKREGGEKSEGEKGQVRSLAVSEPAAASEREWVGEFSGRRALSSSASSIPIASAPVVRCPRPVKRLHTCTNSNSSVQADGWREGRGLLRDEGREVFEERDLFGERDVFGERVPRVAEVCGGSGGGGGSALDHKHVESELNAKSELQSIFSRSAFCSGGRSHGRIEKGKALVDGGMDPSEIPRVTLDTTEEAHTGSAGVSRGPLPLKQLHGSSPVPSPADEQSPTRPVHLSPRPAVSSPLSPATGRDIASVHGPPPSRVANPLVSNLSLLGGVEPAFVFDIDLLALYPQVLEHMVAEAVLLHGHAPPSPSTSPVLCVGYPVAASRKCFAPCSRSSKNNTLCALGHGNAHGHQRSRSDGDVLLSAVRWV